MPHYRRHPASPLEIVEKSPTHPAKTKNTKRTHFSRLTPTPHSPYLISNDPMQTHRPGLAPLFRGTMVQTP